MADETLGTARIEIIASLDTLSAGLESARVMVADTGSAFESVLSAAGDQMLGAVVSAGAARDAWLSLGDAALSLAADIEKMNLQLTILNPLLNSLSRGNSLSTPGSAASDGLMSAFPGSVESGLADAFAGAAPVSDLDTAAPASEAAGGAPVSVHVHNYTGASAITRTGRTSGGGKTIDVIVGEEIGRQMSARGPAGQALEQTYSAQRTPIAR
jgi:hypothetical protein